MSKMRIVLITCILFLVGKHILNVVIRFSNIFPQTIFEGEHYLAAESSVAAHVDTQSYLETGPIYVYNFNY